MIFSAVNSLLESFYVVYNLQPVPGSWDYASFYYSTQKIYKPGEGMMMPVDEIAMVGYSVFK